MLKKLPQKDIHSLCSGQVILSLYVAVKELVENAMDASCTSIQIILKNYGIDSIQVIDNGTGIHPNNYPFVAQKHYTCKINQFQDIIGTREFGFRGEAISSLCALSKHLSIMTSTMEQQPNGSKLDFDSQGNLISCTNMARSPGTTVTVEGLFDALPVRLKEFKRNAKKEFSKAIDCLYAYALNTKGIRIQCCHVILNESQILFQTQASRLLLDNILSLFGSKITKTLIPFQFKHALETDMDENEEQDEQPRTYHNVSVSGYISKPCLSDSRNTPDKCFLFINDRPCDLPKLSRLIHQQYKEYVKGKYPAYFLNVILEPGFFDVNVTPDKRTIIIQQEDSLYEWIQNEFKQLFEPFRQSEHIFQPIKTLLQSPTFESSQSRSLNESNLSSPMMKFESCHNSPSVFINNSLNSLDSKVVQQPFKEITNVISSPSPSPDLNTKQPQLSLKDLGAFRMQKKPCKRTDEIYIQNVKPVSVLDSDLSVLDNDFHKEQSTFKKIKLTVPSSTKTLSNQKRKSNIFNLIQGDVTWDVFPFMNTFKSPKYHSTKDEQETNKKVVGFTSKQLHQDNQIQAEEELTRFIRLQDFEKMEIIGQFNLGFIIVKLNADLFVVDQHASDEKYTFESLMTNVVTDRQNLVIPIPLDLSPQLSFCLLENANYVKQNGFDFLIAHDEKILLTQVPQLRNMTLGKSDLEELLYKIMNGEKEPKCSKLRVWYASKACRTSVMIGMALTRAKMSKIITNMGKMSIPWSCPHGRPSMRHLYKLQGE